MGITRRKSRADEPGPSVLLPAGDPGCWLVRASVPQPAPVAVRVPKQHVATPVLVPAAAAVVAAPEPVSFAPDPDPELPEPVVPAEAPVRLLVPPRPARERLAAVTAALSA
jgi:hypothetical protein